MDEIERQLKDLGEQTLSRITHGTVLAAQIARRARIRKTAVGLGSLGLIAIASLGGYVGIRTLSGAVPNKANDSLLAVAAERTEEEGSARIEIEMSMKSNVPYGTRDVTAQGIGVVDFENGLFQMRLETDTGFLGGRSEEIIQAGDVTYTRYLPSSEGDLWSRSSPSGLPGLSGGSLSARQFSPSDYFDQIKAVSDAVEVVGEEQMDGEVVTHYRATINSNLALDELPSPGPSVAEQLEGAELGFDPMDIWLDSSGRVRRITSGGEFGGGSSGFEFDMRFSMHFYDFGVPVHIEVPDAEETTDEPLPMPSNADLEFEDPVIITGNSGFSKGPYLSILRSDSFIVACVVEVPEWAETAAVVEESSEDIVVEGNFESEPSPGEEQAPTGACFEGRRGELDALVEDPSRYVLHLVGGGRVQSVELRHAPELPSPSN